MDRNKPLLSVIFFIGLSFWGIQTSQAAVDQTGQKSADFFNVALPDVSNSYGDQTVKLSSEMPLQDYGLTLFNQAKLSVGKTFRQGLVTVKAIYEIVSHSFFVNLLESMFQPTSEKSKPLDLKAALPATAWIFLSLVLGVLGLKKRNASLSSEFY